MAKTTTHQVEWLAARIGVALGKTGHSVTVQTERLDPEVLAHVFGYGLKQVLNDAAAGGKTTDEKVGLFNKKLEALYEGTLRAARESDPVAREAKRIATDWLAAKGVGPKAEDFKAKLAKVMADEKIQHLARVAVERAKELDLDIEV